MDDFAFTIFTCKTLSKTLSKTKISIRFSFVGHPFPSCCRIPWSKEMLQQGANPSRRRVRQCHELCHGFGFGFQFSALYFAGNDLASHHR